LAGNLGAPLIALERLSADQQFEVRVAVAGNRATPSALLERLVSEDGSKKVRSLASQVLERRTLASGSSDVLLKPRIVDPTGWPARDRENAARDGVNMDLLRALSANASTRVANNLARNPLTPPDVLDSLSSDRREVRGLMVARGVAENPSTPDATLLRMALGDSVSIRRLVSRNPNASIETKAAAVLLGTKRPKKA